MTNNIVPIGNSQSPFDSIRHVDGNGNEFWCARELMTLIAYPRWADFKDVIKRAEAACQNTGNQVTEHFSGSTLTVKGKVGRSQSDVLLSRYGAYLTAMNADPRKSEVAIAQRYFAAKCMLADYVIHKTTGQIPSIFPDKQEYTSIDEYKDPINKSGFVYLLSAETIGQYKIGYSSNVYKRAQTIQTSCPFEIRVIHRIFTVDAPTLESKLHDYYEAYRNRGEWFSLTKTHVKEFMSVANLLDEEIELSEPVLGSTTVSSGASQATS